MPPTRRRLRRLLPVLLAVLLVGGWLHWPAGAEERAGWRADLADLEAHVSRSYANLDHVLATRGLDPRALHDSTAAALERARTTRDARRALRAFAAAFGDGHFHLTLPAPALVARAEAWWTGRGEAPAPDWDAGRACAALGYEADDLGLRVAFDGLPGWTLLDGATDDFPAGHFPLADGRRAGVVRIPLFSAHAYRSACAVAWSRVRDTLRAPCDERCAEAVQSSAETELLERLGRRAEALRRAGAALVVVDLTGNGGGNDVVDPMARVLTARPLRAGPMPILRHPHAAAQLEWSRGELRTALARPDLPAARRAQLAALAARVDGVLAETRRPCDRSGIWRKGYDPKAAGGCSMLVRGGLSAAGLLDYAAPGALADLGGLAPVLFKSSAFTYREGVYAGPLAVLVDGGTASAAEGFAALLRDNGAAVVLGERTWGAGCGYTDGGIRHTLAHTGLEVRLPDCVRERAGGANELDGIVPDVAVELGVDDAAERVRAALGALPAVVR